MQQSFGRCTLCVLWASLAYWLTFFGFCGYWVVCCTNYTTDVNHCLQGNLICSQSTVFLFFYEYEPSKEFRLKKAVLEVCISFNYLYKWTKLQWFTEEEVLSTISSYPQVRDLGPFFCDHPHHPPPRPLRPYICLSPLGGFLFVFNFSHTRIDRLFNVNFQEIVNTIFGFFLLKMIFLNNFPQVYIEMN